MVVYKILDPERRYGKYLRYLLRNEKSGILFVASVKTPSFVHREVVKRRFWKDYKIDIDKPFREIEAKLL